MSAVAAASQRFDWRGPTLLEQPGVVRVLGEPVLDEVRVALRKAPEWLKAPESAQLDALPRLRQLGGRLRHELIHGSGVVWMRGAARSLDRDEEARVLYALLGRSIGTPLETYGVLYEVSDRRSGSYRTSAIPVSMTSDATGLHTDSSSVRVLPDVVGLLCEQPSAEGGDSVVSNGFQASARLEAKAPELARRLRRPFVRDVVTPGIEPTPENLRANRIPILAGSGRSFTLRYMRYWIERGQERAGEPLEAEDLAALDAFDAELESSEHTATFRLERGDILWVNNRAMAHGRTAYQTSATAERRLQRMWLDGVRESPAP